MVTDLAELSLIDLQYFCVMLRFAHTNTPQLVNQVNARPLQKLTGSLKVPI